MRIKIWKEDFVVAKSKKFYPDAFANIRDDKEITVIIEESKIDKKEFIEIEKGWKLITFDAILSFNMVGFIAKVSNELAKENVSIFIISSFSTDHILVKKKDLEKAKKILEKIL